MIWYGLYSGFSASRNCGSTAVAAPCSAAPPQPAASAAIPASVTNVAQRDTVPIGPSSSRGARIGVVADRVVRWRAPRQPLAKRPCRVGQAPLLEDRERHRTQAALGRAGRETLAVEPVL